MSPSPNHVTTCYKGRVAAVLGTRQNAKMERPLSSTA